MIAIKKIFDDIFIFFVRIFYKIIHKELTKENEKSWIQFLNFCIVGVSNFLVNYIVFIVCIRVFGMVYHLANVFAFIISVFNAFFWNDRYVFKGNKNLADKAKRLLKTYISYALTGLLLIEVLLFIELDVCHISEFIAPVINLFITTPINFLLNKFWAFKKKEDVEEKR